MILFMYGNKFAETPLYLSNRGNHMLEQENLIKASDLNERAIIAKGSEAEVENLITEFTPFLRNRVARYSAQFEEYLREDLFSVAMSAFYEAIQSYDDEKGYFFPFADRVVCARIIDNVRKIQRHRGKTVSLDDDEQPNSAQAAAINAISVQSYEESRRREDLAEEIEQFKSEIASWGITMESLVRDSPKHKELRNTYKKIVFSIAENADIIQTIKLKRYFPVKKISEITKLPQKKLERARTFIIASLIIKTGDYDLLTGFLDGGR